MFTAKKWLSFFLWIVHVLLLYFIDLCIGIFLFFHGISILCKSYYIFWMQLDNFNAVDTRLSTQYVTLTTQVHAHAHLATCLIHFFSDKAYLAGFYIKSLQKVHIEFCFGYLSKKIALNVLFIPRGRRKRNQNLVQNSK